MNFKLSRDIMQCNLQCVLVYLYWQSINLTRHSGDQKCVYFCILLEADCKFSMHMNIYFYHQLIQFFIIGAIPLPGEHLKPILLDSCIFDFCYVYKKTGITISNYHHLYHYDKRGNLQSRCWFTFVQVDSSHISLHL